MGNGLQIPSGRVIALGRLLLATLFQIAIWFDTTQPAASNALLLAYSVLALTIVIATWNNWWLDARIAGPVHAADIVLFLLLVLGAEGYTSPFFTFFVFVLLSAAIRWGWRATALTAALLTLLYTLAGLLVVASNAGFDAQRFVVRTGHLVILSLILIWFGINQWQARLYSRKDDPFGPPSLDQSPLDSGLRAAMRAARASVGTFVWLEKRGGEVSGIAIRGSELSAVTIPAVAMAKTLNSGPFLYDFRHDRALTRDEKRNLVPFSANELIAREAYFALELGEGLAIAVRSSAGEGLIFLETVAALSTDHIEMGEQIASDVAAHVQGHALLRAAEESAETRSRLTLARDLHDSVVQFLAGAAFRLEAMKRAEASGRALEPDLNELKQLMLQEQQDLRSFISALRSGPVVTLQDLARDLQALADRLSRHWDVGCKFSSRPAKMAIPTRLHLDALQLMREAVANAVRHAAAKAVTIKLAAESDRLRFEFINDGKIPRRGELETPNSLKERVEQAGGELDIIRGIGLMKVVISLPIEGRLH